MNEENIKQFHPELTEYYQKGDCCTWIVELRKQVSEKDKEIERLNNIINTFEDDLEREVNISVQESLFGEYKYYVIHSTLENMLKYFRELKDSGNK